MNPRLDPALSVELTWRERDAWMTQEDWSYIVEKYFTDWNPA